MTENAWDEARLQQYIDDEIEESLTLDYKARGSIDKSLGKKSEITKDVSAMANSAGGTIIYGIAEYQDKEREHLPEKITPINRTQFSKEWLEHIISNIRPKVDGLLIHPVQLRSGTNDVAYVVEIPASNTAHQAKDKRYYKRFNFESVPMDDYEIRDVMNRGQHPKIELEFQVIVSTTDLNSDIWGIRRDKKPKYVDVFELEITAINVGNVYAQYVQCYVSIPSAFIPRYHDSSSGSDGKPKQRKNRERDGVPHYQFRIDNTVKDRLSSSSVNPASVSRYDPILPKLSKKLHSETLSGDFEQRDKNDLIIEWITFADNAAPNTEVTFGEDIQLIDRRDRRE